MKKYWLLLAVVSLLLTGFETGGIAAANHNQRKTEIEAAVTWYNAILADCYRNLDMTPLTQVATKRRATTTYTYMASLGEAGVRMDARLKKITFGTIKDRAPAKVEIPTAETWDYAYFDIKTGQRLFDNSVSYHLVYELVQQSDKWLVSGITVKETRERKDSTFIFKRPADRHKGE